MSWVSMSWVSMSWVSMSWVLVLWAVVSWPASVAAMPKEPLVTDRPGNGNAASSVPPHQLFIEGSLNFLTDRQIDAQQLSAPTLLRFGVLPWVELRAGTGILGVHWSDGASVHSTDTLLGTKFSLPNLEVLDVALSMDALMPTGDGPFDGGVVSGEARLLLAKALPAGFGLLVNAGADLPPAEDSGRQFRPLHVVNLNHSLPSGSLPLSVFVESFGRHPLDGAQHIWQLDVGLAYLASPDFQLDVFSQHGLTDAAPDLQVALGASVRLGE